MKYPLATESSKKRRRKRATKDNVDRKYKCVVDGCEKAYGSENSRN